MPPYTEMCRKQLRKFGENLLDDFLQIQQYTFINKLTLNVFVCVGKGTFILQNLKNAHTQKRFPKY